MATITLEMPPEMLETLEAIKARLEALEAAAPRYLTVKAAADYLTVSVGTVQNIVDRGELRAIAIVPGRIGFDRNDLDAYMESRKRATPLEARRIR